MTNNLSTRPERLNSITATDMAVLFSLNPYECPSSLVAKKTNPMEHIPSAAIRRGHLFEPAVLEAFKIDMGMQTKRNDSITFTMNDHRIAATPDAFFEINDKLAVVECKSIANPRFLSWYLLPPFYYLMQVHTQMMVLDANHGYIGALEATDPYRFIAWKIERDPDLETMMQEEVKRFWKCFDAKEKYRSSSEMKCKAKDILERSATLVFPIDTFLVLEDDVSPEAEKIRATLLERFR